MRKTFMTLSVAAALFAGQAMADQATADSLAAYGVDAGVHAEAIASAEGSVLVQALKDLIADQPAMAATIVAAAINANPSMTDAIVAAAIEAAPGQEQAIRNAVTAGQQGTVISTGASAPTSSMPSVGGSGGGSPSVASPN
ncbi:hypothetical protein TOI97_07575 [Denitrificimonas sp. JX-1]|uniref:Uncharacterized protein n=1 Tax=Denitrificimonas halotolerans TaxID=3098930 RepID=A0ABU5GR10_9GAMM|nr:hypothetical protein [Denitrificimonas sp. JX-1]MDY7219425.1 hypothetical protein [Denitrificimonas sp. JX-1]